MKHFIGLFLSDVVFFSASLFFFLIFLFLLTFFVQYIYISYNLKGICKIVFNNESNYKIPLEFFNFYFLSLLPLVFWRETLNIKKNKKFKKLYSKEFYFKIEKDQLVDLLDNYPFFSIFNMLFFSWNYVFFSYGFRTSC